MESTVKAWEEIVIIPTYGIGKPEKNPVFSESRVYQGSSGVVYPHPIIENIGAEKKDKKYKAVFLENECLKIMILPELGGRVQRAFDKVKNRDFIYYNQVIKPALVGLTGPWISGGIEFNWPQHHRPSTFEPVEYSIQQNDDGSFTVWVNEVERMFRTKGMAGFTLYCGKAYLEIKVQLYNRTAFPQSFLWWANPAVKVNDQYQSVFPPDVNAVYDHGRRDVSEFPVATRTYYKVDYSPGTDISRYKNIPVPTSYMAVNSKYDFVGGYEHDTKSGLLHVADHHISPGKKQWTWGNSDFGQAWDRNLTDEDGPYIELMTGAFTDNQPDFSWLMPNEEKSFVQYFMPYSEVGLVKNATKDAMVNLTVESSKATIVCYATADYKNALISLKYNDSVLFEQQIDISPEKPFLTTLFIGEIPDHELYFFLRTSAGKILVAYKPEKPTNQSIPEAARPAKLPAEIDSIEQLYLTGLHLEQYRHATYRPEEYYSEALRRESGDVRCNTSMGLLLMRKGLFANAEIYFTAAISTLTQRNSNPYDGEPFYYYGKCLQFQGKMGEAYNAFYKSVWNAAWQENGYFALAQIESCRSNFEEALQFIEKSLVKNGHNHKGRHLKVTLLRKLNRKKEALDFAHESLMIDEFNLGSLYEVYLLHKNDDDIASDAVLSEIIKKSGSNIHNYIEYALDYYWIGLFDKAIAYLNLGLTVTGSTYPMAYYYLAFFYQASGQDLKSLEYLKKAQYAAPEYCFPNQVESVFALQYAISKNPGDAMAPYYLGNYWYDKREYNLAINCWENSVIIDENFPTVHRNLALAYFNKLKNPEKALASLEKAFELDKSDARVFMELNQLHKILNYPVSQRLAELEQFPSLVLSRDDLYLEFVTLLNSSGEYQKALELISTRKFHSWEGGEGKVVDQFLMAHFMLAWQAIHDAKYADALILLNKMDNYPANLGEGKLYGVQENEINYSKGVAHECLGNSSEALHFYQLATHGVSEPVQAVFYNDPQPDKILYQGLAWLKLGDSSRATSIFNRLVEFGNQHINDSVAIDYFAVSLPDLLVFDVDLDLKNRIHCLYMMGLGNLGFGGENIVSAWDFFNQVLKLDVNHRGAKVHQQMMVNKKLLYEPYTQM